MGIGYITPDRGHYDYDMTPLPGLPGSYRGPAVDPSRPYGVCLGAAQTFGRFCEEPYPLLLGRELDLPMQNLGVGGVSARHFDRPQIVDFLNRAELIVLQVMAARSEGNSRFDNGDSGRLRGRRVSDGKSMRFEEFLDDLLRTEPPETVAAVVAETRANYLRNAVALLTKLRPPKVLLWLSAREPDYRIGFGSRGSVLGAFPQLVDAPMVEALAAHCDAYVACVSNAGLPQPLWPATEPVLGTQLREGMLYNAYYPSPEIHREAAARLVPACRELLRR